MNHRFFAGCFPARRLPALIVVGAAFAGLAFYWASASASRKHQDARPVEMSAQAAGSGSCRLELGGEIVPLEPGQGIRTGNRWRNCETYDGHSLIVFSSRPPQAAAMKDDDGHRRSKLPGLIAD